MACTLINHLDFLELRQIHSIDMNGDEQEILFERQEKERTPGLIGSRVIVEELARSRLISLIQKRKEEGREETEIIPNQSRSLPPSLSLPPVSPPSFRMCFIGKNIFQYVSLVHELDQEQFQLDILLDQNVYRLLEDLVGTDIEAKDLDNSENECTDILDTFQELREIADCLRECLRVLFYFSAERININFYSEVTHIRRPDLLITDELSVGYILALARFWQINSTESKLLSEINERLVSSFCTSSTFLCFTSFLSRKQLTVEIVEYNSLSSELYLLADHEEPDGMYDLGQDRQFYEYLRRRLDHLKSVKLFSRTWFEFSENIDF